LDKRQGLKQELRKRGYKLTRQRKTILEVLSSSGNIPMTARDIFERVTRLSPGMNFSTVYRNIEILLQENIITRVELHGDAAYYELSEDGKHHHHLVCKGCGNIQAIEYCPLNIPFEKEGFIPVDHRFEVYGYCRNCVDENKQIGLG
jgi:Fe2+ or Zn2+ uptake regulation protein